MTPEAFEDVYSFIQFSMLAQEKWANVLLKEI